MTERWRTGLEGLSKVPMSEGLLERAKTGSTMPDPTGPGPVRRVAIALLALALFSAGSFWLWGVVRLAGSSQVRPAADQADPQRVYGESTCTFQSTPEHKFDFAGGTQGPSDPVGTCQALWRAASDAPPPGMIACIDAATPGHISVVEVSSSPDGTCSGIDASPLPDGWDANLDRWHAVQSAIAPYFPSQGGMDCQRDGKAAVDVWRSALDESGFTSWRVGTDDKFPGRPCFNYDINYDAMQVTIVHDTES
jgi:hypothetical protein